MSRTLSLKNLYDKKHKTFEIDGVYADVLGQPEKNGAWLIWGAEKHGKTAFALLLALYLSYQERVLYVSAEEGTGKTFIDACKRLKLPDNKKGLHFLEWEPIDELKERLKKRRSPRVVFIDNMTIYYDELKNGGFRKLLKEFPDHLFIFLAHEERNEPYTATAKLCRKLAKIIVHVEGLRCLVSGRCPGGTLMIDEQKAELYHGTLTEEEVKA